MSWTVRSAAARGHSQHGWLDSWHTFSFADHHDEAHMGCRALRVIDQDRVAPGAGFGTHPHRDMETFSYVTHSEYNPSRTEGLQFLQIWIQPDRRGLPPNCTEWKPLPQHAGAPKVLVISPDGREQSARIHQDAFVHRIRLETGTALEHDLGAGRGAWLQVITGELVDGATTLHAGDGASTAGSSVEALPFDLG